MSGEDMHLPRFSCDGLTENTTHTSEEKTPISGTSHVDNESKGFQSTSYCTGAERTSWESPSVAEKRTVAHKMQKGHRYNSKSENNSKKKKCCTARALATQWLSLLIQRPSGDSTPKTCREPRRQHQEQHDRKCLGSSSFEGRSPPLVSFKEAVIRGAASIIPSSLSPVSAAVMVSESNAQCDGNKSVSGLCPSPRTFALVPEEEEEGRLQLIRSLREISLTGLSLGAVLPHKDGSMSNDVVSSSSTMDCGRSTAGLDREAGKNGNTNKNCDKSSASLGDEEQWEEIRMHFDTVRRLVQNHEELKVVLDNALGRGWCLDDEELPRELDSSSSDEMTLPPSQAMISGSASPRVLFSVEKTSVVKQKQQEQQSDTGVNVAASTLNYNAAPFESRMHVALSSLPLGTTPNNSLDVSLGTPVAEVNASPARRCSAVRVARTKKMTESEDGTTSLVMTAVPSNTTPLISSLSSSPAVTFKLESREEMLRRRTATAAQYAHSGTVNYYGNRSRGSWSGQVSPLLPFMNSVTNQPFCPFDYLLILDFEATCEESTPPSYLHEIIEFPVIVVDVRLQRSVAEFHRYVKPKVNPQLSEFCRCLTGIQQEDIDNAMPLDDVIRQFERWYAQTIPPGSRTVLATDGPTDLREFMYVHSVTRQGIRFPSMFYQWVDVKRAFAHFFQCQQGKIKVMLEVLRCPFEGRLHSGIDDARNIARIVIRMLQLGCTFCEIPLSRLPYGVTNSTPNLMTSAEASVSLIRKTSIDRESSTP